MPKDPSELLERILDQVKRLPRDLPMSGNRRLPGNQGTSGLDNKSVGTYNVLSSAGSLHPVLGGIAQLYGAGLGIRRGIEQMRGGKKEQTEHKYQYAANQDPNAWLPNEPRPALSEFPDPRGAAPKTQGFGQNTRIFETQGPLGKRDETRDTDAFATSQEPIRQFPADMGAEGWGGHKGDTRVEIGQGMRMHPYPFMESGAFESQEGPTKHGERSSYGMEPEDRELRRSIDALTEELRKQVDAEGDGAGAPMSGERDSERPQFKQWEEKKGDTVYKFREEKAQPPSRTEQAPESKDEGIMKTIIGFLL